MNASPEQFSFINRRKTTGELVRLSMAAMGIEFAYSAETAFVSPVLIQLGVDHSRMLSVWAIAPSLGLVLGPLLGAMSDGCRLPFGRRRPFIVALCLGIWAGLLLIPFGREVGSLLGDKYNAIVITVFGMVLIDFNADVCQNPTRAYLIEVTRPEDHTRVLSIFMILSGIGGFLGYLLGAIDWNSFNCGHSVNTNIKIVFLMAAFTVMVCTIVTVTSFKEMPLKTQDESNDGHENTCEILKNLIKSIIFMPSSILILFLTNLLSWMAHLSYVLYFTDYVGEIIFNGDPQAEVGTEELERFKEGVRFGCYGLATYSASCAAYSLFITALLKKLKLKIKYLHIMGLSIYTVGMAVLSIIKSKPAVILASVTAGIQYGTLFNIPYILLAHYHITGKFGRSDSSEKRGLGADIAIVGSTVFIAQLILSLSLGLLVDTVGGVSITTWSAALLSLASSFMTFGVTYLDL